MNTHMLEHGVCYGYLLSMTSTSPGFSFPGEVPMALCFCFIWDSLNRSLSGPLPGINLPKETLPGANAPDNIAPRVIGTRKPLHHDKVTIHGGYLVSLEKQVLDVYNRSP